jgi:hypothetical protein
MTHFGNLPLLFTILEIFHYNFSYPWSVPFYTPDYPLGPSRDTCISILSKLHLSSSSCQQAEVSKQWHGEVCGQQQGVSVGATAREVQLQPSSTYIVSLALSKAQATSQRRPLSFPSFAVDEECHKSGCKPDEPVHWRRAEALQRSRRAGPRLTGQAGDELGPTKS